MNIFQQAKKWCAGFFALFIAILLFAVPQQAALGVQTGLNRCYSTIIPALFPFFIVSELFLQSPFCKLATTLLIPITSLLHLPKEQGGFLLTGWVGGFASSASAIGNAVAENQLSKKQAQQLLVVSAAAGPSFVIGAVGCLLLGSVRIGVCLYLGQLIGCVVAAFITNLLFKTKEPFLAPSQKSSRSFAEILSSAVNSTLIVCGYVVFFQMLYQILPKNKFSWSIACLLEMTLGCSESAAFDHAVLGCAVCISLLGICAFAQISSLTKNTVSLLPLLFSRLIHLPIMLASTFLLLRLWPAYNDVWVSAGEKLVIPFRMPCDAALIFFLFCITACLSCRFALYRQNPNV